VDCALAGPRVPGELGKVPLGALVTQMQTAKLSVISAFHLMLRWRATADCAAGDAASG
jgi:hypothetical protein